MFKNLAGHRQKRAIRLANIVRPDNSYTDLLGFQRDGYTQVIFVKNPISDQECAPLNGNIYEIIELLKLDNPLFRISHPNCLCKFSPYGQATGRGFQTLKPQTPVVEPATVIKKQEVPPMTIQPVPPQTKTV